MNKLLIVAVAFLLIGILPSCKNKKGKKNGKGSTSLISKQFLENQLDFEWFYGKASMRFKNETMSQGFSSTVKIRKDSAIWMNVKKLGIEGGRALLTPDSIFIMNRLDKEYYKRDYAYFKEQFNIETDFQTLQQIIIGNAVFVNNENLKAGKGEEKYQLFSSSDGIEGVYSLDPTTLLLSKMFINDPVNEREMTLGYSNYKSTNIEEVFSFSRIIDLNSLQTGASNIQINFSKAEFNIPKTMPFVVSSRYTIK